jgi:membrane peptidoglycan carboxypeptidase
MRCRFRRRRRASNVVWWNRSRNAVTRTRTFCALPSASSISVGTGRREIIGASDATETYFGKTPADVTLAEAALLAGIIGNPNALSPVRNPDRAAQRRNALLEDMLGCGYITRDEYVRASQAQLLPHDSALHRR